ncbi:MAG: xanthine dehydrogenase family protein molybdopterin-binding subunit [Acetobacteraceae bacterium]|nr:xanthine dehydrogenase family protein molybdopterin-binding subunit [Acetobacteraceae bacterium]
MNGHDVVMPDRRALLKGAGAIMIAIASPFGLSANAEDSSADAPSIAGDQLDSFLAIGADGKVTAFNGHVDLGTGVRTALGQIVAEELDVPFDQVTVILGDTDRTPDQGPTIASATIQVAAIPLRQAAAQAREILLQRASDRLGLPIAGLVVENGVVRSRDDAQRRLSYGALIGNQRFERPLSTEAPLKAPRDYKVVGAPVPRVDIPAKVTGGLVYVHDMRVPGMLHARVVLPPYAGVDSGASIGRSLISVDESSVKDIPGIVRIVTIEDFVGIVAEREENAIKAAQALDVTWKSWAGLPNLVELAHALRAHPSTPRTLKDTGNVDAFLSAAGITLAASYIWPYQMHGSIGPSCALADVRDGQATVWSGTQNPHSLRADLTKLLDLPSAKVHIVRMEAAGCYGRNCADDVSADAALLSQAVGRPVRVQLMREQEHGWEPKGAGQLVDVRAGIDTEGRLIGYDFSTSYPSNAAPTLALLLTRRSDATPVVADMGDRTAVPPYEVKAARIVANDMAPIIRAAWLRGVSALPNVFAHESMIDELAAAAKLDPIMVRLRNLEDPRGIAVLKAAAERAGWDVRPSPNPQAGKGDVVAGRGVAYARYFHSKFPGFGAAWVAWVAQVEVNRATGEVRVVKVVVAQDCGLVVNPNGVRQQIHGNVIQATSRTLKEAVTFGRSGVTSLEWSAYPILTFPEVPEVDIVMIARPDEPPLGTGESASVPSAAAIANAIFDAAGVRLREAPFTPDRVKMALESLGTSPT